MNNFMIAQRFEDAAATGAPLDATIGLCADAAHAAGQGQASAVGVERPGLALRARLKAALNAGTTLAIADEYEALVQFLYLAPIGLAQLAIDGEILFINPLSAQLLMPLSRDGNLANLFTALESVAPQLRHVSEHFAQPRGMICDGLRIQVNAGIPGKSDPQVLS